MLSQSLPLEFGCHVAVRSVADAVPGDRGRVRFGPRHCLLSLILSLSMPLPPQLPLTLVLRNARGRASHR